MLCVEGLLAWLVQGAVGPALVGLPVTLAATDLAAAARRWFVRRRHRDGLSRIVRAASGDDVGLSRAEFAAVRGLLEQEGTWELAARGTVEDLAARIASCLTGGTSDGELAAGRAIAAGLLEFAIGDLEPGLFQQVLFARLDRLRGGHVALDEAMAAMHADLAALAACQAVRDADRFAQLMGQLGQVLDRLPGPADRGEVAVYLAVLIRWLNTDPWLPGSHDGRPMLVPASVERKLAIADASHPAGLGADADELARECERLVVLGGPGSGKTWLARRTARLCAEAAMDGLAAGRMPDEVELPLFTTCAQLAAVPSGEVIRRVIVSSALAQLPDLGGARITDAVRLLFEERHAPTLLVADSLDEARGADDRIRLADSLHPAWRIMLTSRPAYWHGQLALDVAGPGRRVVGNLQPLRYPDDVEPVITGWLAGVPERAADLSAELRAHPALQRSATVPLILAFYCIAGGDQPLPGRRAELYGKVIRRMLAARWRGSGDRDLDPDACLDTLRDWAWSAAAADPVSGTGAWASEFATPRASRLTSAERNALDHIAVPVKPTDDETGKTSRQFVHQTIYEHLVAEHIAQTMSAESAAAELLKHLWYDPDWEYAAPAALAMHPQRSQILTEMIRQVTGCGQIPADLVPVDGCWEIRGFLARVAQESCEGDWTAEAAEMIAQARLDLATAGLNEFRLLTASNWPTSNGLIIKSLFALLSRETDLPKVRELTQAVAALATTAEGRTQARQALLALFSRATDPRKARELAEAMAGLDPSVEDQEQVLQQLLVFLSAETDPWVALDLAQAVAGLDPPSQERAQARQALLALLPRATDLRVTDELMEAVAGLAVTAEDQAQARQALLALLSRATILDLALQLAHTVAGLDPSAAERAQARQALLALFLHETVPWKARWLAQVMAAFDPSAAERAQAREALLALLSYETIPAKLLGEAVAVLAVTAEERAQARRALLELLSRETDPRKAGELAQAVAGLNPPAADQARALQPLLAFLSAETDEWVTRDLAQAVAGLAVTAEKERAQARRALLSLLSRETNLTEVRKLAQAVAGLAVTAEDRAQARQALLALLCAGAGPWWIAQPLAEAVAGLDPPAEERAQARQALLALLSAKISPPGARWLAEAVAELDPSAEERAQARHTLLGLLSAETPSWEVSELAHALAGLDPSAEERAQVAQTLLGFVSAKTPAWQARSLVEAVAGLDPPAQERAQARQALLAVLSRETAPGDAWELAQAVAGLDPPAQERAQARQALLAFLSAETDPWVADELVKAVTGLTVTAEDRAHVRHALLAHLPRGISLWLAEEVAWLDPSAEERAQARQALLAHLSRETDPGNARWLTAMVAGLSPTVADLDGSESWPRPLTHELLAAVRQHSTLSDWLSALPMISRCAQTSAAPDGAPAGRDNELSAAIISVRHLRPPVRRVGDMGAFDSPAACFVRHGGSFPAWARGVTGWPAGRRQPVFGRLPASGEKWPALAAAGWRACRRDGAGSGVQARRLTGAAAASWVGPGRPAGIAPGGFPRPARRTRRAALTAPGAPRVLPAGFSWVLSPAGVPTGPVCCCRGSGSG